MSTLSIPQIFSNLSFYQENYLQILENPDCYYTSVQDASIHVWPLVNEKLYLGDLLQLWFGNKWVVNNHTDSILDLLEEQPTLVEQYYLHRVEGNLFSSSNHSKAWSQNNKQSVDICIESLFKFYCLFKSISRPEQKHGEIQIFKSAV